MRSDFEMLPFVALMLDDNFKFVEQSNEYTHKNHTEHRVTLGYLNGAWLVYQHQQSKVDKLQKRVDAIDDQLLAYKKFALNIGIKLEEEGQRIKAKKCNMSTAAEKLLIKGLFDFYNQEANVALDVEQALKGGDNDQI